MMQVAAQGPTASRWHHWDMTPCCQLSPPQILQQVPGSIPDISELALQLGKRSEARGAGSGDRPRACLLTFPAQRERDRVCVHSSLA